MTLLLFHHHLAQHALEVVELGGARVAWAGQVDGHVALDGAGTVGHDDGAVGQVDRFLDRVRDEDDGGAEDFPDFQQFILQVAPRQGIQRAERFIHQHDGRIEGQHAGDGHALAHAAGQVFRVAGTEFRQAQHAQQHVDSFLDLGWRLAGDFQAESDIALDGHPREQRVFLEYHAAVGTGLGDQLAAGQDLAGSRLREAGDGVQEGRLAAAGRPQQADELAAGDFQVDVFQGDDVGAARGEDFIDCIDIDRGHGRSSQCSRPRCHCSK